MEGGPTAHYLYLNAGEDDYEQVEKGRVKAEVEGEEAGKME